MDTKSLWVARKSPNQEFIGSFNSDKIETKWLFKFINKHGRGEDKYEKEIIQILVHLRGIPQQISMPDQKFLVEKLFSKTMAHSLNKELNRKDLQE